MLFDEVRGSPPPPPRPSHGATSVYSQCLSNIQKENIVIISLKAVRHKGLQWNASTNSTKNSPIAGVFQRVSKECESVLFRFLPFGETNLFDPSPGRISPHQGEAQANTHFTRSSTPQGEKQGRYKTPHKTPLFIQVS